MPSVPRLIVLFVVVLQKAAWPIPVLSIAVLPIAILPIVAFTSASARADIITEQDLLVDIPQIHTATRLQQDAFTSPAAVTVIDRETIQASPTTELPMLMRFAPGFLAYNVWGNFWGVTSHGLGNSYPGNLEVTVDGRSVYEPIFSAVEWSSLGIELDDIDAIEVVRGPNAATQGSNAFNGAINIITRKPLTPEDTHAEITVGDLNTRNASVRHTGQIDAVNYSFSLGYRYNDGFPAVKNAPSADPAFKIADSDEALHARLVTLLTPTTRDTLEIQLGGGYSNLKIDNLDMVDSPKGFTPRDQKNHYQMLRWTRSGHGDFETQLNVNHNRLQSDDARALGLVSTLGGVPPEYVSVVFPGEHDEVLTNGARNVLSERYETELNQTGSLTPTTRLAWGGAARLDRARSYYLFGTRDTLTAWDYRLSGNLEWRVIPNGVINLGSMLEYNDIVGSSVSPRLAYNHALGDSDVLRCAVTRGHRNPSLLETHQYQALRFNDGTIIDLDIEGSTHLRPETITAYEVGYLHRFAQTQNQIDIKLFEETIRDGILRKNQPFDDYDRKVAVRTNRGDWQVHGAELEWQWQPTSTSALRMAYAYGVIDDSKNGAELSATIPRSTLNVLWQQRLPRDFRLGVDYYYQSAVDWPDTGSALGSFDRVDIKFGKVMRWENKNITVNLIAQNLFGDYAEFNQYHIFERRLFLNAQLDL